MSTMHRLPGVFVLLLMVATWSSFCRIAYAQTEHAAGGSCLPRERDALLAFKHGIDDHYDYLVSWQHERHDCCRWTGITCSNTTGHIIQLDLSEGEFYGKISSSLLSLEHLEYLDLHLDGGNGGVPEFLGSFKNLRHLDFSSIGLSTGTVSPHLGNLSKLEYLDLSYSEMYVTDISWLTHLPRLAYLDLSHANLSSVNDDWLHVVNMLPALEYLSLSSCSLSSGNQFLKHQNLTNLHDLDLSYNSFGHPIASAWFWNVTSIENLVLFETSMYGPFPNALGNMTSLRKLSFGFNWFYDYTATRRCNNTTMAVDLRNLCDLEELRLDGSFSSGNITKFLDKLPQCPSNKLRYLTLKRNNMVGVLAEGLDQLTSLTSLDLSYNRIAGSIPLSIGSLSHLEYLDLSNNHLTRPIPSELGNCTNLQHISLSNNNLTGPMPLGIASCTELEQLDLSYNHLTGPIPPQLGNCTVLDSITLSNNILTGNIPPQLGNCNILGSLSLPNNHLTGPIPLEIANCTQLAYLTLSSNHLTGHVPSKIGLLSSLIELDLSNNNLDGGITEEHLVNLKWLKHMDLSNNSLSGPLPSEYGAPKLVGLSLSFNYFSGHIPKSICMLRLLLVLDLSNNFIEGKLPQCSHNPKLAFLHLSNNRFSGKFPSSLRNYSSLAFMDLSKNNFYGKLPSWIGELVHLRFVQLSHNLFDGDIPASVTQLKHLQYLSLAGNGISGVIPLSLSNLTAMCHIHPVKPRLGQFEWYNAYVGKLREVWPVVMKRQELKYGAGIFDMVGIDLSLNHLVGGLPNGVTSLVGLLNLNLSWNHLSEHIPANIGSMRSIESLDLSRNNLSGKIPLSLSVLTYLSSLDLSYNNLEGRIPPGSQLDTLYLENPSIYTGNTDLCGPPLERNCSVDNAPKHAKQSEKVSDTVLFFYFGFGSGFVASIWVVFCVMMFKKGWRVAYFQLFDRLYDDAYVFVVVNWGRIKGKETSNKVPR